MNIIYLIEAGIIMATAILVSLVLLCHRKFDISCVFKRRKN